MDKYLELFNLPFVEKKGLREFYLMTNNVGEFTAAGDMPAEWFYFMETAFEEGYPFFEELGIETFTRIAENEIQKGRNQFGKKIADERLEEAFGILKTIKETGIWYADDLDMLVKLTSESLTDMIYFKNGNDLHWESKKSIQELQATFNECEGEVENE